MLLKSLEKCIRWYPVTLLKYRIGIYLPVVFSSDIHVKKLCFTEIVTRKIDLIVLKLVMFCSIFHFRYYRFTLLTYTQWKCSYPLFHQYRKIWAYHSGLSIFSSNGRVFRDTRYSMERWQRRIRISNNQWTQWARI